MTSLRKKLFLILVAATSTIWLLAACWIYKSAKQEVEDVLDARLQEAARMVSSLVSAQGSVPYQFGPNIEHGTKLQGYERQLSCQIWSLDGHLVARSSGAPDGRMSDVQAGFTDREIEGELWRVYTIEDETKGIRVLVGDRLSLRAHLVAELIKGLLAPTLLIIPMLGFLIWTSLGRGLRPLRSITEELHRRSADDMQPLTAMNAPSEIEPVVRAFNNLFAKIDAARQHEREITAFAAHELRTPLAGLKTHAQIAMAATDAASREAALRQIVTAVDRTVRLVRQLLAISRLDTMHTLARESGVNLGTSLREVIAAVPHGESGITVLVDPEVDRATVNANRDLLLLALKNLHENAVNHMPNGGNIHWSVRRLPFSLKLVVEDEGPGIPEEELALVTRRFYRGRHKSASGSGLGLAIVELALRANDARLELKNKTGHPGLRAEIFWDGSLDIGSRAAHAEKDASHLISPRPVHA